MNKKKMNYLAIILYSIILIIILKGTNHLYGSNIDWINQHTTIPELFRNIFYETKRPIPNYLFNIGAGQNIFNYSYYGLMSPIILISYLLPFLDMKKYIELASIVLYIVTGILLYKFLLSKKNSTKLSLLSTISFQTFASITYHFHHHIMFVWYFPFLILALKGVDKYRKEKKSLLLIISIFLIIMTNYYYSVPSIITITIYGTYTLLQENLTGKELKKEIIKSSIRIITPILMSAFLLLPTALTMFSSKRTNKTDTNLINFLIPNIEEIFYSPFSIGVTILFLIASIGNLCTIKRKKSESFLNTTILILTLCPIIMYILNGTLYIRGKVLIPILPLYILITTTFIKNLKKDNINKKKLKYSILIFTITLIICNIKSPYITTLIIDCIITIISLYLYKKRKKTEIIFIPLITLLLIISLNNNKTEKYASTKTLDDDKNINELLKKRTDKDIVRINNLINTNRTVNKIYNENHYSTSTYSSTYNNYYHDFYNFHIGNNIERRNTLNTSGANNYLFNKFMGVKYILSKKEEKMYTKIDSYKDINLYLNTDYNPLIYEADKVGSKETYENLKFPYNLEYLMNYSITKTNTKEKDTSSIKEIESNLQKEYKFSLNKEKNIKYKLPQRIENKILILSFDMKENELCSKKNTNDVTIEIEGIKNKLTCKDWLYHNKNYSFEYIITSKESLEELNIKLSKGKYHITNIKIYTMNYPKNTLKEIKNLSINKKTSTIRGNINLNKENYIITSLPYDEGFKVYLDNKEIKKEVVNTAFLGFKSPKGKHNIKITYTSPGYNLGKIITILSICITLIIIKKEKYKKCIF